MTGTVFQQGGVPSTVHDIEGPRAVETVRDDLLEAIHRCDLLPGQAISLRSLAEERRVRLSTLVTILRRVERDEGLIDIRGDVAVVAPFDAKSLASIFRLARQMWPALRQRACELATSTHLDRLEQLVPRPELAALDYDTNLYIPSANLTLTLFAPAATAVDRHVHQVICSAMRRYSNFTARYRPDSDPGTEIDFYLRCRREVLELLRAHKIRAASSLERQLGLTSLRFAETSLELPHSTDDDQPIAPVIPLRTTDPAKP